MNPMSQQLVACHLTLEYSHWTGGKSPVLFPAVAYHLMQRTWMTMLSAN